MYKRQGFGSEDDGSAGGIQMEPRVSGASQRQGAGSFLAERARALESSVPVSYTHLPQAVALEMFANSKLFMYPSIPY